ncbi:hypothetical protein RQP46_001029 [Phenoliferia psychrophenolica]
MEAPYVGMQIAFDLPAPRRDEDAPRGGTGSQVLPVADLPDDYEGSPDDGMEYLFLVRREASTHPAINRAENPYAVIEDDEPAPRPHTPDAPEDRPSEAWRAAFVKQFEGLRTRMRATPLESTFPPPTYGEIPSARDESEWRVFINGRRIKRAAPKPTPKPAAPKELTLAEVKLLALAALELGEEPTPPPAPTPTLGPAELEPDAPHELDRAPHFPTPALLLALDQPTKIHLLSHINDWLVERSEAHEAVAKFVPSTIFAPPALRRKAAAASTSTPTPSTTPKPTPTPPAPAPAPRPPLPTLLESQWILSILASLDSLLAGDDISTLRTLIRTITDLVTAAEASRGKEGSGDGIKRSREDEDEAEKTALCWMAVAAVAATWGQGDLWNSNLW